MRKTPAFALIVLATLILASATPVMLQAQNRVPAGGNPEDLPNRTARAFAPFLRAVIMRRMNTAQQIFKVRRPVMQSLEQPDVIRLFGRFQRPDHFDLNLIGGRMLGKNIGILLFTIASEEGPIYFKIYYYGYADQIYIDRVDISDDWDDLEFVAASVDTLQTSVTVSLTGVDDGGN